MILVWRVDTHPSVYTTGELDTYMGGGFRTEACAPSPRPFPDSTVDITSDFEPEDFEPADFFYAGPVPIVSGAMREVLERFTVDAEFIKVCATRKGMPYTAKTYFYFNLLDAVDCLDFEKSDYLTTDHGDDGFELLVIDEAKVVGHHLFRIGPIPTSAPNPRAFREIVYCASESLASAVIASGLTGVVFVKPEHWRDYPPRNVAWVAEN